MLTIILAAVLGLLGVVAVVAYAHQANQRAVAGLKAETVMIATNTIPAGTSLSQAQSEHWLGTEKVPVSSLSTTPVQSPLTTANGREFVSATVVPGQVLLTNMLTSAHDATVSGGFVIPPGMIAVTADMCIAEAVAGYITPGSKIAVFDTVTPISFQRSCEASHQALNVNQLLKSGTAVVVPEAQVLAVGPNPAAQGTSASTNVTANTDPSSASSASVNSEVLVTLAVNQDDAERLMEIAEVGMPYMALLGPGAHMTLTPPVKPFQFQQQP